MATILFSSIADGSHIAFDPDADLLRFDSTALSASALRITTSGGNLGLTIAGKTVWLDGTSLGQLSTGSGANITFANKSVLAIGDGTSDTLADDYGQTINLAGNAHGVQVWGLGGADKVSTGSGADWLVGNIALAPLNHVSRLGGAGSPNGSVHASISADGRFVGFAGGWTEFGSTNDSGLDVFVKDMNSGIVSDEHRTYTGANGGSGSGAPVISADGSVLAFLSASHAMVPGSDSDANYDIYVSEVGGAGVQRVSTGSGGTLAADGGSYNPDLSGDGRYVAFESTVSNWAAGGSTTQTDIFVKDRQTGTLTRVSTSLTGGDGNGESTGAKISADGRFVVFESAATNLTAHDTNGYADIFVWDRNDGSLINLSDQMNPATTRNPNSSSAAADVAYDHGVGGVVVFQTAKALVAADTSSNTDIYAYHLADGSFELVSSQADGGAVQLGSEDASVSGDGRFVVFTSYSDALVAGDSNGTRDIFVKDLSTGQIALVSKTAAGVAANGPSLHAQISLGGEWIVFESSATNLATTDANGTFSDVFRVANPLLKDTLIGGAGNDTYVLDRADVVTEALNGGTDTVRASIGYTLGANLENLVLTGSGNSSGTGNALNNVITGNAGNNRIDGVSGVDTASYAAAGAAVHVSLALTTAQATGAGSDTLLHIDNLIGSAYNDTLTGNSGANRLDGGLGNDTLTGGSGADTYVANSSADVIVETGTATTEIDTVVAGVNWTLGARLENLTLTGTGSLNGGGNSAANLIIGNSGANHLYGYAGNDTLNGGAGNDTLTGATGNDTYVTDSSADVIVEAGTATTEIDTVIAGVNWTLGARLENLTLSGSGNLVGGGNSLANVLKGNGGANLLSGASGNDQLLGGAGNDTLVGGAGADTLGGGSGSDSFRFSSTVGADTVSDFSHGGDRLQFSQLALHVGDGDLLVEGAVTRSAAGGFSKSAELVIFSSNVASLTTSNAAAAIGSATSAYAIGQTALFTVDTGTASGVYLFTSSGADAHVSAGELTLLATLSGVAATLASEYVFSA